MTEARMAAGLYDHGGWAVVVICTGTGSVVERRRIELIEPGLPKLPHHHDAQGLPMDEAVAMVERVRASAFRCAGNALAEFPADVRTIAIRKRQALPPTVAERITNYRAQNVADWVMYRDAIAEGAKMRGWSVHEYDPKTVLAEAAAALDIDDISAWMQAIGKTLGPPWQQDHRLAAAAAIVAAQARPETAAKSHAAGKPTKLT